MAGLPGIVRGILMGRRYLSGCVTAVFSGIGGPIRDIDCEINCDLLIDIGKQNGIYEYVDYVKCHYPRLRIRKKSSLFEMSERALAMISSLKIDATCFSTSICSFSLAITPMAINITLFLSHLTPSGN